MFKNRQSTALLTITLFTLLWSCTSGAMNEQLPNETTGSIEKNEKNEKNKVIKPFATDQEAKEEYLRLWEKEEALTKIGPPEQGNFSFKKTENEIAWEAYYEELQLFYQRLFRSIVKKDIENKAEYTISLGLRVTNDGALTMDRLPITEDEAWQQNALLFKLSIDPDDVSALEELKKLYEIKKKPSKSADQLFPKIILASKDKLINQNEGGYLPSKHEIWLLREKFSIKFCRTFIHEVTHLRQRYKSYEMGGIYSKPIAQEYDSPSYPGQIAAEIDADVQSIVCHPHPEQLLKELEEIMSKNEKDIDYEERKTMYANYFPYLAPSHLYAIALEQFKLMGNEQYVEFAKKSYEDRKKFEKNFITNFMSSSIKTDENADAMWLPLLKNHYALTKNCNAHTTIDIRIPTIIKSIFTLKWANVPTTFNTLNPLAGSKEFFDIKRKVLKELEDEKNKKPENKIEKN